MTDYHQLWTSPSGIQSTFSAAARPPTVAMTTDWLVPAEPKPGEAEKEWSRLSGLHPLPQAGCGGPSVFGPRPPPWKPVLQRKFLHNALASQCEFVGLAVELKAYIPKLHRPEFRFSSLLPPAFSGN